MMIIKYDDEIDAAYITISNNKRYKTMEYSSNSNMIIDYDFNGEIIGVEVLHFLNSFEEVLLFFNSPVLGELPKFDLESLFLEDSWGNSISEANSIRNVAYKNSKNNPIHAADYDYALAA